MSKKIVLPRYEQLILDLGTFSAEQLESIVKCAKFRLADMRPKVQRKKKAAGPAIQERAS